MVKSEIGSQLPDTAEGRRARRRRHGDPLGGRAQGAGAI